MLYIFHVDTGTMMTFDMDLAMESVENLKQYVKKVAEIPTDKQVLLISGGECLNSTKRVCSYSAGTDTNPIFLFSKLLIESTVPPSPSVDYSTDNDLRERVKECADLPASYSTVAKRAQLAQQFHDLAKDQMRICEKLVHDQHMQQQGWAAVVANLEDITDDFRKRSTIFENTFKTYMRERDKYLAFLEHFNEDLEILQKIPILSVLLIESEAQSLQEIETSRTSDDSSQENTSSVSKSQDITLLEWMSSADNRSSMGQLYEHCAKGLEQFDDRIFKELCCDVEDMLVKADNSLMKEVKGLGDRLSGLEQLMREAKRYVQEQADLATSVTKNQSRASNLKDASILPDLCATHRKQLSVMAQNHQQLCDIRRRCTKAKEELSVNLYHRLKWVTYIENSILEIDQKLCIHHESLVRLRKHLEILQQIHLAPATYLLAVAEVVRRRTFSQAFLLWASELACHLLTIHNEEVSRRKEFQSQFEGHFLTCLFPGMEDLPPSFATQAPAIFDSKLPRITQEDIDRLKIELPELADNLNIPDVSVITNFFIIKSIVKAESNKIDDLNAVADKLAQAAGDVATANNLDPNFVGGSEIEPCLIIPHGLPHLRDLDRGCESETDTEEFEKLGQSPMDLHFDKEIPSPRPGMQDAATTTEGNLEISKSEHEKLKTLLLKMGELAAQAIKQLKLELNDLKILYYTEKTVFKQHLSSLSSSWENISTERDTREKDIIQRLSGEHQSEINDFRKLAQVKNDEIKSLRTENAFLESKAKKINDENIELKENILKINFENTQRKEELEKKVQTLEVDKEKSIKEVSDRLNREHKAEMENIRTRFKLMTMERSPSESSLEKIDRGEFSSLTNQTSIIHQMTENFEIEKDKAVNESVAKEKQKWEKMLQQLQDSERVRETLLAELSNKLSDQNVQLDLFKESEKIRELECEKYKNTIHQLTTNEIANENAELVARVEILEEAKATLETELEKFKSDRSEMAASVSVYDEKVDSATSPMRQKISRPQSSLTRPGKISMDSCKVGDCLLIIWDEQHENFKILQDKKVMYFLHSDCVKSLGLEISEGPPKNPNKHYSLGEFVDKEYCHARKPENRYKVPKGTKFFRVTVRPLTKSNQSSLGVVQMTQSQTAGPSSGYSAETAYHSLPSSPARTPPLLPELTSTDEEVHTQLATEDDEACDNKYPTASQVEDMPFVSAFDNICDNSCVVENYSEVDVKETENSKLESSIR